MFYWLTGPSGISTKNLLDKCRKIANEYKSLPIAIALCAKSLKGQHQNEWDVALKSLKKFCYDYLKDEKAMRLFLLCSVFRENEEIPIERLTRLCIGAGLIGEDYGSYEDARIRA
ncbi:disease resistance protein (CC-NBS-LRR class) family protein, partial [Trifolium medium]|nr:disease resistance protein (CC-NBS-LRR class) family protein [Trifolium medium]